ncbi:MAG: BTAD domain-containing putative transcriptional regulator [Actinomycetota bacterium]
MAPQLEFSILGPLVVTDDGVPTDIGAPKHRALLSLLLCQPGRVVSVDRLIDQLWHGDPPTAATATLQAYVSNLRRALEPGRAAGTTARVLVTRPPGYALDIAPEQVDAVRFERNVSAAIEAHDRGALDAAAVALADALSCWRGQPLADVVYEPWAQPEIARLNELHLIALETQLAIDLDRGRHRAVSIEAERLAKENPVRERFRELLMLALYRSGRQADALRAYQDARDVLVEQLGIEPGPALRALEERILAQDPALDWQRTETGAPAGDDATVVAQAFAFVGRANERVRLTTRLSEVRAGVTRLALISGEPGIGKTRLCEDLAATATAHGARVVWARGWEGDGAPAFWPWVQVLRTLAHETATDVLATAVGANGADLARVVPEYASYARNDDTPPDAETARFRFFEAVSVLLNRLGGSKPLVIVLDDLHWADASSLRLLEFAVGALQDAPVLLVGTYRDAEARTPPLASSLATLARTPELERIPLGGLSVDEIGAYVTAVLGDDADPTLADSLHDRTAGNPFFVAELVRLLEHDGRLGEVDRHAVPEGVRDVIRTRLARLPAEAIPVLTAGAIAGREFDVALVAHVCGLDEDRALDLVESAWMTGIVDEAHDGLGHFRFSHELVRDTLCEDLTALRRIRLHRRIGEAIEELHGERNPGFLTECAHHFAEAAPAGDPHKAVLYGQRAADRLVAQLAYAEAVPIYERAIVLADSYDVGSWQTRVDLSIGLGWALRATGRLSDARATLRHAMDQASAAGDPVRIARAVLAIGGGSFWGYWDEVGVTDGDLVAYLERALEELDDDDSVLRSELLARLSIEGYFAMTRESREAVAAEALAMARRLDDPVALAAALVAARLVGWQPDNLAARLAINDELIEVSAHAGNPFTELIGHHFRMIDSLEAGDRSAADADLAACEQLARRLDHHAFHVQLAWFKTMMLQVEGRFAESEALALETYEINVRSNPPAAKRSLGVQLYGLRREQGRHAEIEPLVRAAVERQPHMDASWRVGLAHLLLEQGRVDEAQALLDEVMESGDLVADGGLIMPAYVTRVAEIAAGLRDARAAAAVEPWLDRVDGDVCMLVTGLFFGATDRFRGDVALAQGRFDDAIARYEHAIDVEQRLNARAHANRSRLALAVALAARNGTGDQERVDAIAAAVVAVASELGTPTVAARAQSLLPGSVA